MSVEVSSSQNSEMSRDISIAETAVDSDAGFGPSVLGTKEYWENVYQREIVNFKDTGDIGEIWFGEQVAAKMVSWVANNHQDRLDIAIVDVGCGNGHLLIDLAERGFTNLTGIDYSPTSIQLAHAISQSKELASRITYRTADIFDSTQTSTSAADSDPDPDSVCASPQFDSKFSVALDKGTYDAISLADYESRVGKDRGHIADGYSRAVAKMLRDEDGVLVITSCNWTEDELVWAFRKDFELMERLKHKRFTFGGMTGQTVVTLILKKSM